MTREIRKEGMNRGIRFHGEVLLDLLYPKRCPLCDRILEFEELQVCEACIRKQVRIRPPYCMKCGKTIEDEMEEYCNDCNAIPKTFIRGFPAFAYTGAIKDALYAFKYKNQRSYSEFFADCILHQYREDFDNLQPDGIVPVPVHRDKLKSRGYNQAEVLAKALSKHLQVPVYSSYILRVVNTNPQKELNDKTRMKNLKNAFKIGENKIKLKKVLLVDDIYTSGATIEACTRVLSDAGVENVYYTSVAIGKGYSG